MLHFSPLGFRSPYILSVRGHFVAQATIQQRPSVFGEISAPREAWLKGGVCISSRYCWFCAAARPATSSTHSPACFLPRPPNRAKVAKNWSCPLNPDVGIKLRIENAFTNRS